VTASANVPPQGKSFRVSLEQMQMWETFVSNNSFGAHLHLSSNRW
jgi:hypothetical protein